MAVLSVDFASVSKEQPATHSSHHNGKMAINYLQINLKTICGCLISHFYVCWDEKKIFIYFFARGPDTNKKGGPSEATGYKMGIEYYGALVELS